MNGLFLLVYLGVQVLIGVWIAKRIKTENDYFLAERSLTLPMVACHCSRPGSVQKPVLALQPPCIKQAYPEAVPNPSAVVFIVLAILEKRFSD